MLRPSDVVPAPCSAVLKRHESALLRFASLQIYTEKGFTPAEAHTVMAAMTRKPEYADYFVDHMMVQELGVSDPSRQLQDGCSINS